MTREDFAAAGFHVEHTPNYREHTGGVLAAPQMLITPFEDELVTALRAHGAQMAVQHVDDTPSFVSLTLRIGDAALYLALSAADLRSMGTAMHQAAEDLERLEVRR